MVPTDENAVSPLSEGFRSQRWGSVRGEPDVGRDQKDSQVCLLYRFIPPLHRKGRSMDILSCKGNNLYPA